jgi:hypothetical protein
MHEERTHITSLELARWLLPIAMVVLGVVLFFLYHRAAPPVLTGGGL